MALWLAMRDAIDLVTPFEDLICDGAPAVLNQTFANAARAALLSAMHDNTGTLLISSSTIPHGLPTSFSVRSASADASWVLCNLLTGKFSHASGKGASWSSDAEDGSLFLFGPEAALDGAKSPCTPKLKTEDESLRTNHRAPAGKGLFLSSATAANYASSLRNYERAIQRSATAPYNLTTSPSYIHSIAVQSLSGSDGELRVAALDTLLPALTRSRKRLYIGTNNGGNGTGSYCGDLLDASWRHANVALSVSVAKAFLSRYPSFEFDAWYISPEQFLNYLADGCLAANHSRIGGEVIAAAQGAYLKEWTESLHALKPLDFLWSPSVPEFSVIGDGSFDLTKCRSNLRANLGAVLAAAPLLNQLAVQDSMGKASSVVNGSVSRKINGSNAIVHCEIAAAAASEQGRGALLSVSINAELMLRHKVGGKTLDLPCDPREVQAREVLYMSKGWGLGPSWEMSFWYRQQTEEWALPNSAASAG